MPTFGMNDARDTACWLKCRAAASAAMIAQGWNKHARKFNEVMTRRAAKLYRSEASQ